MRGLLLLAVLAAAAVTALPAAAAQSPDPCVVLTANDATSALGAKPPKPKTATVGVYRTCTYAVKKKTMTVKTRRVATQSAFDKSAKSTKGLVFPMQGTGADTYSLNGTSILVWKKGTEVTIAFTGVMPVVGVQQDLAKIAVARL